MSEPVDHATPQPRQAFNRPDATVTGGSVPLTLALPAAPAPRTMDGRQRDPRFLY